VGGRKLRPSGRTFVAVRGGHRRHRNGQAAAGSELIMEIAALVIVLVILGIAFIAFRVLKKSVKFVFRLLLVLVLLFVAAVIAVTMMMTLR